MNYVVKGRKPEALFAFFEQISAIPRPSYHEEAIADYLERFAKERGLYCYRDATHNVLIKKPASVGMENRAPILFQGHTDMVCEKNSDVEHDFLRDPLKLWVDGKLLRAKGTTLGADNGIAVAVMLALLDGAAEAHPALECLFTSAEEVGLDGANAFDYSLISARRMVNMDSEALGTVTCGCAGGVRSDLTLQYSTEPFSGEAICVRISGLMGGHSGEHINRGRANANKLMGRLLAALDRDCEWRLIDLNGGSKDNAIPRECVATVAVADAARAADILTETAAAIARELSGEDRGFTVAVEDAEQADVMLSREDTLRVAALLSSASNGVLAMSHDIEGLVEFSRNLGVVKTDGTTVKFVFSARSAKESQLDAAMQELDVLASALGFTTHHHNRYPGWDFAPVSPLRDAYLKAYATVVGKDAKVNAIHAGLECGIISSKISGMDIIAVGPNMFDIHSPDEALDLDSTEVLWKIISNMLAQ